ncbi:platelet glycoprotein Ib alpha chain isoform X2 [Eleutherodactylus coqui]
MFIMNFFLPFGLFNLIGVHKVFSQTSCSTEKNFSKNKEETSCINLGLSILPLTDIPPTTAILILSSNNFKSLSTSSFKGLKALTELEATDNGMTSFEIDLPLMLEELNLANNTLKTLPKVSQLPSLTILQLSNNLISNIPDNAFKGLKKLTRLELQHNQIYSLHEEVFEDLRSLIRLDLSHNQLWMLPDHLLSNVENLEILYLSGNRLTNIPDQFFADLELTYVYLEKNPWHCDCALQYFKNWLEEDENRVYEISKDGPTKNQKSVVCHNGIPLIEYEMSHCSIRQKGDGNINSAPVNPGKTEAAIKAVPTQPLTTPLQTTTPLVTTELLKTEKQTTQLRTTTHWPTTTSTTETTTILPTTTPTTETTTTLPTTTPTTETTTTLPTTTPTTETTTTPTTETTTILESTRTTEFLKPSPRTTVRSTTTPYPTTLKMMTTTKVRITTEKPSTTLRIMVTTDVISTSEVPTSKERVKLSTMTATSEYTQNLINTMLPARRSRATAAGIDWLAKFILEHCCLLHVIIYGLCILLLLVEMMITMACLLWVYCCNRDLLQWLPGIRLIRYSMRVPMSDEDILLVNNGAVESHFRDQSMVGVTKMLVLESHTQQREIRYTSAIL